MVSWVVQNSLVVNVVRGSLVESKHEVTAVVVDSSNRIINSWGNYEVKIFPRSSIKPIQAMAIVLSGADKKFDISPIELALSCASHSGENQHVNTVKNWLKRMNLTEIDLECGAHLPMDTKSSAELLSNKITLTALQNNCSGKHTGMLATALALGVPTKNYIHADHPVQKLVKEIIENFSEEKIDHAHTAIDGCSIPTYNMKMRNLALAMARFSHPSMLDEAYQSAAQKIYTAATTNPFYVAGSDRYCTRMMSDLKDKALIKTGAEGVMFAAIPSLQAGVVVKAADGATRAAESAMSYILNDLKILNTELFKNKYQNIAITNWNGIQTGHIYTC